MERLLGIEQTEKAPAEVGDGIWVGAKRGAQKKLAEWLEINPNVITNWKNGTNKSYRGYLKEIAALYGVSEDYLLTGSGKKKTTEDIGLKDFIFAILNEAQHLSDPDRSLLILMAKRLNEAKKNNDGEAD